MDQDHSSDVNVDMEEEEDSLVVTNETEDTNDDINHMEDEESSAGISFCEPIGAKKRKPQKTTKLQVRSQLCNVYCVLCVLSSVLCVVCSGVKIQLNSHCPGL